jgi:pilus assembly protein TadC
MVEAFTAAGPLDKVRERVAEVAERGDGVFLTPATYFIPPEQIGEYKAKIIEAFGSAT